MAKRKTTNKKTSRSKKSSRSKASMISPRKTSAHKYNEKMIITAITGKIPSKSPKANKFHKIPP